MSLPALALVPLLADSGGVPSQDYMPFVALAAPVLLVLLLLLVVGRQRRRNRHR